MADLSLPKILLPLTVAGERGNLVAQVTFEYDENQLLAWIVNSFGVLTLISERSGLPREKIRIAITGNNRLRDAFQAERERNLDVAELVVHNNIHAARKLQIATADTAIVDSSDAKWLLSRQGKDRGYSERLELAAVDVGKLTDSELEAIISGEFTVIEGDYGTPELQTFDTQNDPTFYSEEDDNVNTSPVPIEWTRAGQNG